MIGAHNSFTYLNGQNCFVNMFKLFWKCQKYDLSTLYNKYHVRFFDIRICKKNGKWVTCHGLAKFNMTFDNIEQIFKYMKMNFDKAQYRIVLEICSESTITEFKKHIDDWIINNGYRLKCNDYKCSWIGIKQPWQCLYINSELYPKNMNDYCCRLFNWDREQSLLTNIKNFKINYTIKNWAQQYNPKFTIDELNDTIDDNDTLYFMDYIDDRIIK